MNILSFGGGVQTVTMVAMCINGDLPKPDYAIFADPGWESKATYDYIGWFKPMMEKAGIPLVIRSKGNIRIDALTGRRFASLPVFTMLGGKKGMLRRQCTNEYKVQVVHKAIREVLGVKKYCRVKQPVNVWLGISRDEAIRMKPSRVPWIKNTYPLIDKDMTRQDCILYLTKHGIKTPPKSACIGCPFHGDDFWRDMKKNSPSEFEDACDFDDRIRHQSARGLDGLIYLHAQRKPLREVNFDDGMGELFGNECEGHCGL